MRGRQQHIRALYLALVHAFQRLLRSHVLSQAKDTARPLFFRPTIIVRRQYSAIEMWWATRKNQTPSFAETDESI